MDFNKKILIANTIINATQAAVSLTNASVGLGKAIYDRKALQAQNAQRENIDYIGISQQDAVNNGYVPYDDNGKYIGFDDYTTRDGRTIGQIKEEIKQAYGKDGGFFRTDYFGNMAYQDLENGLRENELKAQRALQQREHELNVQIRNDDMNNLVNKYALGEQFFDEEGNEIPIETVIANELNRHPMSPEQREIETREWIKKANHERTMHDVMSIGASQGMDGVKAYLEDKDYTAEQRRQYTAAAQQASNQAVTTGVETGRDTYRQNVEGGATVGDSVRAALGATESENSDVTDHARRAIQQEAHRDLQEVWEPLTAGVDGKSLQELYSLRNRLRNEEDNFQENKPYYNHLMNQLDREINQRQERAARERSSGSGRNASNIIQNCVEEFHRGNMQGPTAIETINSIRFEEPTLAANAIDEIFGLDPSKWNQRASAEYRNLTAMIDQGRPPANRPEERARYDEESRQLTRAVQQAYFRNVTADEIAQLIRDHRSSLASERLNTVFARGDIGPNSPDWLPGIQASEGATAFVHYSNRGGTDLRYSEQAVDPNNPHHTIPLTVGGERAENVMRQTANENRTWANEQLRNTGITLDEYNPNNVVRDERGDRDGVIHYTGNDGRTYRVDAIDPNRPNSRIIEVKVGNDWQRVNPAELRRNAGNSGRGGRGGSY